MDNYIELIVFYLTDWQQAAIDNTRYSVIIFTIAFSSGYLLVSLLKKGRFAQLTKQLLDEQKNRQEVLQRCQDLSKQQQDCVTQLAEVQQKTQQLSEQKSKLDSLYQALEKSHQQQDKNLKAKQSQVDELKSMLEEKDQLLELLRNDLVVQKKQLETYKTNDSKVIEMEAEINLLTNENNLAKQKIQVLEEKLSNQPASSETASASLSQQKITELEETIQQQYQQIIELSEQLANTSRKKTSSADKTTAQIEEKDWFQDKIRDLFYKIKSSNHDA